MLFLQVFPHSAASRRLFLDNLPPPRGGLPRYAFVKPTSLLSPVTLYRMAVLLSSQNLPPTEATFFWVYLFFGLLFPPERHVHQTPTPKKSLGTKRSLDG